MTPDKPQRRLVGRQPRFPKTAEQRQPAIGVTQGGSSRTRGAKPAATDGLKKQNRRMS